MHEPVRNPNSGEDQTLGTCEFPIDRGHPFVQRAHPKEPACVNWKPVAPACPTCASTDPKIKRLVADDSCHEYDGPTLWDPCTDSWHEGKPVAPEPTKCPKCGETLPHLYEENCTDYRRGVALGRDTTPQNLVAGLEAVLRFCSGEDQGPDIYDDSPDKGLKYIESLVKPLVAKLSSLIKDMDQLTREQDSYERELVKAESELTSLRAERDQLKQDLVDAVAEIKDLKTGGISWEDATCGE